MKKLLNTSNSLVTGNNVYNNKNEIFEKSTLKLLSKKNSIYEKFVYGTMPPTKRGTGFKDELDADKSITIKSHFSLLKNTFSKQKHRADYSPKNLSLRSMSSNQNRINSAMDLASYFKRKTSTMMKDQSCFD